MEHVAAADRVAVHERYHRNRQRADLALQIEDVQPGDAVAADIAAVAAGVLVAAGAEGLVAGAGEQDAADRRVVADAVEGVDHLLDRLRPEGVADPRPVDRHAGDPGARMLVEDVAVLDDGRPGDAGHSGDLLAEPRLPAGPARR